MRFLDRERALHRRRSTAKLGQSDQVSHHTHTYFFKQCCWKSLRRQAIFAYRASRDCCRPVPQITTSHGSSVRDSMGDDDPADVSKGREKLLAGTKDWRLERVEESLRLE